MKTLKLGAVALALLTSIGLGTGSLAQTKIQSAKPQDIDCLAQNIYHEARGESLQGQIAVAQVTVNRVKSGKFQNSICKTVFASKQFSWTLDKSKKIRNAKAWQDAKTVATAVLQTPHYFPDFKALYFHTKQVNPVWNRKMHKLATIGNHVFYA